LRAVTLIEEPHRWHATSMDRRGQSAGSARQAVAPHRADRVPEPYGSLNPRKRVGAILESRCVINTRLSKAARRRRPLDMMPGRAASGQYGRYPHMSQGQRQRIAIARA